jgi:toxin ParE1/3/4
MGNQIILAPEAEQDLDEIVGYIAKDNPAAAEKFGIRLIERVELLKSFPRLGREVSGRRGERVLVEGPILIFYRFHPSAGVIQIKRFWHGARGTPTL